MKRWLPSSGTYNLQEYLQLFQWFQAQKEQEEDPFWRLMDLIAENNCKEKVKEALNNQKKPDTNDDGDLAFIEDEEGEEADDEDKLILHANHADFKLRKSKLKGI